MVAIRTVNGTVCMYIQVQQDGDVPRSSAESYPICCHFSSAHAVSGVSLFLFGSANCLSFFFYSFYVLFVRTRRKRRTKLADRNGKRDALCKDSLQISA